MAKRKGGSGILLFVAIFLGLVAAGATGGLVHFYNLYDVLTKEDLPKLQAEVKSSKALADRAVARFNEVAPFVLESRVVAPADFDSGDGGKAVEEAVLKPILSHLVRESYGDMQVGRELVKRGKHRLVDVVTALDGELAGVKKERDEARRTVQTLTANLTAETETARRNREALQRTLDTRTAELNAANERLSGIQREADARVAELNQKNADAESKKSQSDREHNQEVSNLLNEKQRLLDENNRLNRKATPGGGAEAISRDGEITGVAQPLGIAYISIGRHQRVERGMRFKVYAMTASGLPRLKGEVEVRNVDPDSSKVGILSQVSDRDPILVGDMISNPLYDKDMKPVFVVCGEMDRYSREDLVRLIQENGGRVDAKVSPQTDFLVAGGTIEKYENDRNFMDAKQLGIRVMSEKELLGYLPYYGER